jgi:cyclic beta-1,2-glucan synthetase
VDGLTLLTSTTAFLLLLQSQAGIVEASILTALLVIPLMGLSIDLVNWLATLSLYPPHRLPRLRFDHGVPPDCRTMVVVPVILHRPADVDDVLKTAEANHVANADANVLFGFLVDFPDAPLQHMPEDAALLEKIIAGTRELNQRYAGGRANAFHVFPRERRWNEIEGKWMGWERKRGKICEFNRLVLKGAPTSYLVDDLGAEALAGIRFAIVLDADTRLPLGAAVRLIATMAHPLNAPVVDERDGSIVSGYTVIQPRIRTLVDYSRPTRYATWFRSGLFAATRYYPQDVHHCLFGDVVFCGKGIYDIAAFDRSQSGWIPENALLCHDHLEGMHGRVGLAWDVVLRDNFPENRVVYGRRAHRWIRGDWQVIRWVRSMVPTETGELRPSRLSLLNRWRLVENLRFTLLSLATFCALVMGWLLLPAPAAVAWTIAVLLIHANPMILAPLTSPIRAIGGQISWHRAWREMFEAAREECGRMLFVLAFLTYEVTTAADAIGRTLYRLFRGRKGMLEWTAAVEAARSVECGTPSVVWSEMRMATAATLLAAVAVVFLNPAAVVGAMPLLILWLLAPQFAYWTALPPSNGRPDRAP